MEEINTSNRHEKLASKATAFIQWSGSVMPGCPQYTQSDGKLQTLVGGVSWLFTHTLAHTQQGAMNPTYTHVKQTGGYQPVPVTCARQCYHTMG